MEQLSPETLWLIGELGRGQYLEGELFGPVTKGMLLVVGAVGRAGVTTGKLGVGIVVGAPLLTEFCASVVPVTAFVYKIPAFVGSLAVGTGEMLTHSLTPTVSSASAEAASCDKVSRNYD